MKLTVKNTVGGGESCELIVEPLDKVSKILKDACDILNSGTVSGSSLVHKGEVLANDKTAKNYSLKDGDSLLLMAAHPSGGNADSGLPPFSLPGQYRVPFDHPVGSAAPPSQESDRLKTDQRLEIEVGRLHRAGVAVIRAGPRSFLGHLTVPAGRWAGQRMEFKIRIPDGYPERPPDVSVTRHLSPAHPNIAQSGWVCLNILREGWNPHQNLVSVYHGLMWLTENPNYLSPNNPAARRPTAHQVFPPRSSLASRLRRYLLD